MRDFPEERRDKSLDNARLVTSVKFDNDGSPLFCPRATDLRVHVRVVKDSYATYALTFADDSGRHNGARVRARARETYGLTKISAVCQWGN